MKIEISNTSNIPIYQQLFDQISSQIMRGDMEGDYNLPPIRTAAKELGVSIITVKKAWEELERLGLIYSIVGKGCFVTPISSDMLRDIKQELAKEKLSGDLIYYKKMGFELDEVIDMIKELY